MFEGSPSKSHIISISPSIIVIQLPRPDLHLLLSIFIDSSDSCRIKMVAHAVNHSFYSLRSVDGRLGTSREKDIRKFNVRKLTIQYSCILVLSSETSWFVTNSNMYTFLTTGSYPVVGSKLRTGRSCPHSRIVSEQV